MIEDFRCNTGKQFDGQVVLALCRSLLKEISGQTAERRIMKILGKNYLNSDRVIPLLTELIAELDPNVQSAAAGSA